MTQRVKWIVDQYLLKTAVNKDAIRVALDRHVDYVERPYQRFSTIDVPVEYTEGPVIVYGSQQFGETVVRDHGVAPGPYYIPERFHVSRYSTYFDPKYLLNGDYIMLPYALLKSRWGEIFNMFGNPEQLFVRPDSGKKLFTGKAIGYHEGQKELSALEQLTSVTDRTIVCVSKAKTITKEFRYIVVEGQVVAHSQYMENGQAKFTTDDDPVCRALAEEVASGDYQLDVAYVCDVARVDDEEADAYVVEFNSVGTSDWYLGDPDAIIGALNTAALKEYNGEITA